LSILSSFCPAIRFLSPTLSDLIGFIRKLIRELHILEFSIPLRGSIDKLVWYQIHSFIVVIQWDNPP
jgi:hypothetical protein